MIGIVGYGVVGKATREALFPDESIIIHDISLKTNLEDICKCNLVFICIPTNTQQNIEELENLCLKISSLNSIIEIVVRSTVTPGFFNTLKEKIKNPLTYFPEFLRERYSLEDSTNCKRMFYATNSEKSLLINFDRFNYKLRKIDFAELELLKMMRNNYHAMKVVFANHYYDMCKKYGANYDNLLTAFNKVKNGQSYLEVNENLRGYGGKCLPKDIDFMIDFFEDVELFKAIKNDNSKLKITVREDK